MKVSTLSMGDTLGKDKDRARSNLYTCKSGPITRTEYKTIICIHHMKISTLSMSDTYAKTSIEEHNTLGKIYTAVTHKLEWKILDLKRYASLLNIWGR